MTERRRKPLGRLAGLVALGAALAGGCEKMDLFAPRPGPEAQPLGVWVAGDMVGLTDDTAPVKDDDLYDADRKEVSLFAAANESVSFQVVVDAGAAGVTGLELTWGDLAGPGAAKVPAERVRAFRMLPLRVEEYPPWYLRLVGKVPAPTGVYDPLVPLGAPGSGGKLDVPAQGRLALWFDVDVPRDAAAGEYRTKLTISSATRGSWSVQLKLEVYAFVLPDARAVPAIGGFDHRELFGAFLKRDGEPFDPVYLDRDNPMVRQGLVLMRSLMRLAHDHRLDLFDTRVAPVMKRDPTGEMKLLWKDYDAIVMPYLDGTAFDDRIGCAAWPVPFSQDWPRPADYGGPESPGYRRTALELLAECRRHFAELRVGDRTFLWPCRNLSGEAGYQTHAHRGALARAADANTPILCQLSPSPPDRSGWSAPEGFARLCDILAPPAEQYVPDAAPVATIPAHPLAGSWLATGTPPYLPSLGVIATPADVRALPWFAMKYRCTGLFLPDVLNWSGDPFAPVAGAETRLFYPGTIAKLDQPLPSVRLKRLRRGLQDLAYLWILQRRQRPGIALAVMNALVRYGGLAATGDNYLDPRLGGWEHDGQSWTLARRILADEVQAAVRPELSDRVRGLPHRLAWDRLNERTRRLVVEQVRSRVEPVAGAPADSGKLRMTVLVDLFNQHGRDLPIEARLEGLPAGWRALPPVAHRATIAPASRHVLRMGAVGEGLVPTGGDARLKVPVRLKLDGQEDRPLVAAVPVLQASWAKKPPKIDGVLDDWPPRRGNTAREFQLVGARGREGEGLAKRQTMAFVLRDAKHLYIAFRCEEPNLAGLVRRPNNLVHYEQLLACGEDLVEVLLDPGGQAAGAEDLFHLVVKPNGVLISERGVRSSPPLGRVTSWAPFASVAISTRPDAWTVELAVPLSAFGRGAEERFWRVNFMRYAPQGAEASSWSGAPRYFYDPANLGTMFLGAPAAPPDGSN